MSWEKSSVADLRNVLVERLGYTEEDAANVKGKSNLVFLITEKGLSYTDVFSSADKEILDADFDVNDYLDLKLADNAIELPKEEEVEQAEASIKHKYYGQLGWSDYVMSLFTDDELVDGRPKVNGLRRVAETLLGSVVFSGPVDTKVEFPSDAEQLGRACVVYELRIQFKLDLTEYVSDKDLRDPNWQYPMRVFRGVGASSVHNTDDEYVNYPEAIAETRAEARAYKKALMLNTVTADEVSGKSGKNVIEALKSRRAKEVTSEYDETESMGHSQRVFIETKANQLSIDVGKLSTHVVGKDFGEKLTKVEAKQIIEALVKYQANHNDAVSIPEEIKL